jgi:hypothetical protein
MVAKDDPVHAEEYDPWDEITDGPELGILLRTDYADEQAWQAFFSCLQESEKEFVQDRDNIQEDSNDGTSSAQDDAEMDGDSEDDEEERPAVLKVVNPASIVERELFSGISNLTALRLFNEVDVKRIIPPGPGNHISPQNRLIDYAGWKEIYEGKPVWIYDSRSNSDQSVRVVNQGSHSDLYGTAT